MQDHSDGNGTRGTVNGMGIGVGSEGLSEAGVGFAVGDSAGHWCSTVGMKELVGDWAAPLPSRGRVSPGHAEQTNQSLSAAPPMILVSNQHTDGCGTVSDALDDLREHGKAGKVREVDLVRSIEVMSGEPEPFTLRVPDEAIADLDERLRLTRFPDHAPGEPWAYGTDVGWMRDLIAYWMDDFDWRAQEARLNAFPQYRVTLRDIDVHFLHVPGKGDNPCPLLLSHGWPGSVFEFLELIPRLIDPAGFGGDPADAFTVVAPSLPGFGLSFKPGQRRFDVEEIADCFAELMTDVLGYDRFGAQGGDWGSFISSRLAYAHAERMIGIHLNLLPLPRDASLVTDPNPEEKRYLNELAVFLKEETGYQWIQGTRPQTLAFGLTDSPAGLAAWIAEKFRIWSDCGGNVETVFTKDQLLANIGLYWFTGAIGSSFWPYYARMHGPWPIPLGSTVDVPMGYCEFPREILRPPKSLAERTYRDIRRWSVMKRGGHFAAMEQPDMLAEEIREFFRPLR